MLGGPGACSPENVLKNCTIWCILGPILALKILLFLLFFGSFNFFLNVAFADKVSKGAKIRNRYNQVPHLTQDTNGKVKV